jgi:hypothetical protein
MHSAETMTKDLMFKLRLDETDRERLEKLAEHYSAPAATVVRMLIKEKHDEVTGARIKSIFGEHHDRTVEAVREMMLSPPDRMRLKESRRRADQLLLAELETDAATKTTKAAKTKTKTTK